MDIRRIPTRHFLLMVAFLNPLLTVSCQKKRCQAPAEQPFQTIVETQWRLVETTDPHPNFKGLNQTNFFIMIFKRNYTGDFKRVENNDLYETPVATFVYNIDPEAKRIVTEITENAVTVSSDPSGAAPSAAPSGQKSQLDFKYTLGREFTLTRVSAGFFYRFVPFTGIVDPDKQCVF